MYQRTRRLTHLESLHLLRDVEVGSVIGIKHLKKKQHQLSGSTLNVRRKTRKESVQLGSMLGSANEAILECPPPAAARKEAID